MRVNISFQVELDDVPTEVCRLLRLADQPQLAEKLEEDGSEALVLQLIDEKRRHMAETDSQLADTANILAGYLRAKAELFFAEQYQEQAEEVPEEPEISVDVSDFDTEDDESNIPDLTAKPTAVTIEGMIQETPDEETDE